VSNRVKGIRFRAACMRFLEGQMLIRELDCDGQGPVFTNFSRCAFNTMNLWNFLKQYKHVVLGEHAHNKSLGRQSPTIHCQRRPYIQFLSIIGRSAYPGTAVTSNKRAGQPVVRKQKLALKHVTNLYIRKAQRLGLLFVMLQHSVHKRQSECVHPLPKA
jgi:hypothetical protein